MMRRHGGVPPSYTLSYAPFSLFPHGFLFYSFCFFLSFLPSLSIFFFFLSSLYLSFIFFFSSFTLVFCPYSFLLRLFLLCSISSSFSSHSPLPEFFSSLPHFPYLHLSTTPSFTPSLFLSLTSILSLSAPPLFNLSLCFLFCSLSILCCLYSFSLYYSFSIFTHHSQSISRSLFFYSSIFHSHSTSSFCLFYYLLLFSYHYIVDACPKDTSQINKRFLILSFPTLCVCVSLRVCSPLYTSVPSFVCS